MENTYYRIKLQRLLWITLKEIADQEGVSRQDLINMILGDYVDYRLQKTTSPGMVSALDILMQCNREYTKLVQQTLDQQGEILDYLRELLGLKNDNVSENEILPRDD